MLRIISAVLGSDSTASTTDCCLVCVEVECAKTPATEGSAFAASLVAASDLVLMNCNATAYRPSCSTTRTTSAVCAEFSAAAAVEYGNVTSSRWPFQYPARAAGTSRPSRETSMLLQISSKGSGVFTPRM